MTKRLAVALVAALLATTAGAAEEKATGAAREGAGTMEVQKAGKGKATSKRVVKLRAKVTAVDVANRTITLQGSKGRAETYQVSPAVKRLDEIKAGDDVVMKYEQGLILQAQAAGAKDAEPIAQAEGERAPATEAPGGTATAHVRGTVTVVAVDQKSRVVVLEGAGGNLYKVKAGKGIDLKKVKPGAKLVADYTESLAVSIEKASATTK
jgi:hypothetical protein